MGVYVDRDWESTWIVIGMTQSGIGILAICSVAAGYLEYEHLQHFVLDFTDDSIISDSVTPPSA